MISMLFFLKDNHRLNFKRFFIIFYFSNFIYSFSLNQIPIHIDQVGHSSYYLDIKSNYQQNDYQFGSILVDATKNIPIGAYIINNYFNTDSLQSYNYFSWIQGDYLLRDIALGSNFMLKDSSRIKFLAKGISFPGQYSMQGPSINNFSENSLQNYYLDFNKKYKNSKLDFGIFYHLENVGLPVSLDTHNKRYSESIHIGSLYSSSYKNIEFDIKHFIEGGRASYQNDLEYTADIIEVNGICTMNSFNLLSKIYNKNFRSVVNDTSAVNNINNNFSFYFEPLLNNYQLKLGIDYFKNEIFLNYKLSRSLNNYNLTISKENIFSNYLGSIENRFVIYDKNSHIKNILCSYSKEWFFTEVSISNINFNKSSYQLYKLNSKMSFNENAINLVAITQKSDYSITNDYFNLNFHIEPYLFWTNRYGVFFDIDFHYYNLSQNVNLLSLDILSHHEAFSSYKDMFINSKVGLIVGDFKLTYCNYFLSNSNFIISDAYLTIKPISFFQVDWLFID